MFLPAPADFRDDFVAGVSGAFGLDPVLFSTGDDCFKVEVLRLDFDSGMAFVVFLVVKGLDTSFSTSFLGKAGFLELTAELGLDETA